MGGLRVRSSLRVTDRITRRIGTIQMTASGSVSFPTPSGRLFYFVQIASVYIRARAPTVTASVSSGTTTISWTVTDYPGVLIYGAY